MLCYVAKEAIFTMMYIRCYKVYLRRGTSRLHSWTVLTARFFRICSGCWWPPPEWGSVQCDATQWTKEWSRLPGDSLYKMVKRRCKEVNHRNSLKNVQRPELYWRWDKCV